MSLHNIPILAVVGIATGNWWDHLSSAKKALGALVAVLIIGFAGGSLVATVMLEQRGVPGRLARLETEVARTTVRVDSLMGLRDDTEYLRTRLDGIEVIVGRVDDRTKRIGCLLAGNSGPACL